MRIAILYSLIFEILCGLLPRRVSTGHSCVSCGQNILAAPGAHASERLRWGSVEIWGYAQFSSLSSSLSPTGQKRPVGYGFDALAPPLLVVLLARYTYSSAPPGQATLVHGEMGEIFPMRIARLPHAHVLDLCLSPYRMYRMYRRYRMLAIKRCSILPDVKSCQ